MRRIPNPELDRIILNHLADLYKIKEKREGIHLSTLVYCLTKSFFDQKSPIMPTDEEVMLFALGLGLQDVLTPKTAATPVFEKDGILYTPDFVFPIDSRYVELKTTRTSLDKAKVALPETWIEYIMGGCYIRGINSYELATLYILGNYKPPFPQIYSETLVFEDEELQANWDNLLSRKKVYEGALESNLPPVPFSYNKEWECKSCRYKLQCEAITVALLREDDK